MLPVATRWRIRYDTIEEFNVDSKAHNIKAKSASHSVAVALGSVGPLHCDGGNWPLDRTGWKKCTVI